jgi:cysteine-rich repeat protein
VEPNDARELATPAGLASEVAGALSSVSDVDVFTFELAQEGAFDVRLGAPGGGCSGPAAILRVETGDGRAVLAEATSGGCARLHAFAFPAGSHRIRVTSSGTFAGVGAYRLLVTRARVSGVGEPCGLFDAPECDACSICDVTRQACVARGCGNGLLERAPPLDEECDDGNTRDDDGCNATCRFEPVAEREPNDDAQSGQLLPLDVPRPVHGDVTRGDDPKDVFTFSLDAVARVHVDFRPLDAGLLYVIRDERGARLSSSPPYVLLPGTYTVEVLADRASLLERPRRYGFALEVKP